MNPIAIMPAWHAVPQLMRCVEPLFPNDLFAWTHFQGPNIDPESVPTVRSRTVRDRTVCTTISVNFRAQL